jgi:8-oxo-dGTP pyrophosphatase MutT (NUDIX family)
MDYDNKQRRRRRIAGCVPLSADYTRCLLITSRHYPNHLVFPKDGIKKRETARQAAARETWEECGAVGVVKDELEGVWDGAVFGAGEDIVEVEFEVEEEDGVELVGNEEAINDSFEELGMHDPHDTQNNKGHRWFIMVVDRVEDGYPERGQRLRQWHMVKEARHLHNLRPTTRLLLEHIYRLYAAGQGGA